MSSNRSLAEYKVNTRKKEEGREGKAKEPHNSLCAPIVALGSCVSRTSQRFPPSSKRKKRSSTGNQFGNPGKLHKQPELGRGGWRHRSLTPPVLWILTKGSLKLHCEGDRGAPFWLAISVCIVLGGLNIQPQCSTGGMRDRIKDWGIWI